MSTKVKSLDTGSLAHWAARLTGKAEALPIDIKTVRATATSLEEAAAISLATHLMQGKAPKSCQEVFDKTSTKMVADFRKLKPDYKFVKGGRPKGQKNKPAEAPAKKAKAK